VGVDQSEAMLAEASSAIKAMPEEIQSKISLVEANVAETGLENGSADAVTSMGVIGYLPDDDGIFQEASRVLRSKGVFIVSCRNRLFNMVSLSDYTLREIEQGSAAQLVREIRDLFETVPQEDSVKFVESLAQASNGLLSKMAVEPESPTNLSDTKFTTSIDPRQHTPKGLAAIAEANGFKAEGFYGVHPHLMMAGFNKLLPPHVFNDLSDALNGLDSHPLSLIWSSVFIGVFRKQD
jgi:SAM-dependent methyltransferase